MIAPVFVLVRFMFSDTLPGSREPRYCVYVRVACKTLYTLEHTLNPSSGVGPYSYRRVEESVLQVPLAAQSPELHFLHP